MNAKRKREIKNIVVRVGVPILIQAVIDTIAGAVSNSMESRREAQRAALELEKLGTERQELLNEPFGKWRNRDKIMEIDRELFYMGGN